MISGQEKGTGKKRGRSGRRSLSSSAHLVLLRSSSISQRVFELERRTVGDNQDNQNNQDNHKDEAILPRLQLPSSLASRCPVLFGVDVSYLLPMNFRQMNRWPAPCGAFLALQADILVDISLR